MRLGKAAAGLWQSGRDCSQATPECPGQNLGSSARLSTPPSSPRLLPAAWLGACEEASGKLQQRHSCPGSQPSEPLSLPEEGSSCMDPSAQPRTPPRGEVGRIRNYTGRTGINWVAGQTGMRGAPRGARSPVPIPRCGSRRGASSRLREPQEHHPGLCATSHLKVADQGALNAVISLLQSPSPWLTNRHC